MSAARRLRFKRYIGLARLGFHRRMLSRMRPPRIMRLVDLRPRTLMAPHARRPLVWSVGFSSLRTHASSQRDAGERGGVMPSPGIDPADILAAHRAAGRAPVVGHPGTESPLASPTPQQMAGPRGEPGEVRRKASETPTRSATQGGTRDPSRRAVRENRPRAHIEEVASHAAETLPRGEGAAGGVAPPKRRREGPVDAPRTGENVEKPHPPANLEDEIVDRRPVEGARPAQPKPAFGRAEAPRPKESKGPAASQPEAQIAPWDRPPQAQEGTGPSAEATPEPAARPVPIAHRSEEVAPAKETHPDAAPPRAEQPRSSMLSGLGDSAVASPASAKPSAEGPALAAPRPPRAARTASFVFRRHATPPKPMVPPTRHFIRAGVKPETPRWRSQAVHPGSSGISGGGPGRPVLLPPAQARPAKTVQTPPRRDAVYRSATRQGEGGRPGGAAQLSPGPAISLVLQRPPAGRADAGGPRRPIFGGKGPLQVQRATEGARGSAAQEGGGPGPALTPGIQAPAAPEAPASEGAAVDLDQMAADVYSILRRRLRLEREREFGRGG